MEPQTPVTNPTPEPVVPVVPVPEVESKPVLPVLLVILVLLLTASTAFLYYQNQQLKGMLASYQTPVASPTPIATTDLTANWKTYTNPSGTYSFKYSEGLRSDTGAAGSGFESIRYMFIGPKQVASSRTQTELFDGYSFIVTKIGSSSKLSIKAEAEKQQSSAKEFCQSESKLGKTMLDSHESYSVTCLDKSVTTYTSDEKDVYSITQFYAGDENGNYKTITDQMLSTFKFSDQFCGGIAGTKCPTGYSCNIPAMYPDASGTCTKN